MEQFRSSSVHGLDAQKRLVIPKDIRPLLGERFSVFMPVLSVYGEIPHLVVMPSAVRDKYEKELRSHYPGQVSDRKLRRLNLATQVTGCDTAGRVSLREELLDYAGLGDKVVIVGCGQFLELWSQANLDADLAREDEVDECDMGVPLGGRGE